MKIQYVVTPETANENEVLQRSGFPWFPTPPRSIVGTDGSEFNLTGHYTCDDEQLKALQERLLKS